MIPSIEVCFLAIQSYTKIGDTAPLNFILNIRGTQRFISLDICSEGLSRLRNLDFSIKILKIITNVLLQTVGSKFLNIEKLTPFLFGLANISLNMQKKKR